MLLQHIRFNTDQGKIKGLVKHVNGRAVRVTAYAQPNTNIRSVVTIGKEGLTAAEASRASLVLGTFKASDSLLASPFVRKIFFPGYPLHTLRWPKLPTTQPNINFTYRQLNESQRKAVVRCLSNKEEDRHVVIIVSSISSSSLPRLTISGTTRDREDHSDRCSCSEQNRRAQIECGLGYRTIECRSQERRGEIGGIRILGLQAPCLEGFPL